MKPNARRNELWKAVLSLRDADEADRFFGDLMTAEELEDVAMRWQVARMLYSGRPYSIIGKETAMSSRTIARISSWLNNGFGGYRLMLARLDAGHTHTAQPANRRRTTS